MSAPRRAAARAGPWAQPPDESPDLRLQHLFLARGLVFSHEAVRTWEAELTPRLSEELRRRRRGRVGKSWYVDETYLRVGGRGCYL